MGEVKSGKAENRKTGKPERLEGWKGGRVEGWEGGRVEGWKVDPFFARATQGAGLAKDCGWGRIGDAGADGREGTRATKGTRLVGWSVGYKGDSFASS
jgi:hypothetical protein